MCIRPICPTYKASPQAAVIPSTLLLLKVVCAPGAHSVVWQRSLRKHLWPPYLSLLSWPWDAESKAVYFIIYLLRVSGIHWLPEQWCVDSVFYERVTEFPMNLRGLVYWTISPWVNCAETECHIDLSCPACYNTSYDCSEQCSKQTENIGLQWIGPANLVAVCGSCQTLGGKRNPRSDGSFFLGLIHRCICNMEDSFFPFLLI